MINNNKSNIIVASFAVLVFAVMGFAVYTNYKTNSSKDQSVSVSNSSSSSKSIESSSKMGSSEESLSQDTNSSERSLEVNSAQGGQVVVSGQRIEIADQPKANQTTDKVAKIIQDSEFPKNDNKPSENKAIGNNDSNNSSNQVAVNTPKVNITPAPAPTLPNPNNNVYVYRAPVVPIPSPIPVPTPTPPVPTPPIINQRYQSFLNAMSRLKSRGSNILVPIINNNIYALSIESDADLYNVIEYEHLVRGSQKGYGVIGTKTHLETLKCNRYIPNCKPILYQSSNGRYYINLANLAIYT
jgi:hypothetical protein